MCNIKFGLMGFLSGGLFFLGSFGFAQLLTVTVEPGGFGDAVGITDAEDNPLQLQGTSGVDPEKLGNALTNSVRSIVNWFLGIMALIALVVVMYGGFVMLTAAGNEDRYNSGWMYLKNAAIGIVIIGLAWFILSLIFWLTNQTTLFSANKDGGTLGSE